MLYLMLPGRCFLFDYDDDRAWAMHYSNEVLVVSVLEKDGTVTSSRNGGGGSGSILFVPNAMTKVRLGARVWIRVRVTIRVVEM